MEFQIPMQNQRHTCKVQKMAIPFLHGEITIRGTSDEIDVQHKARIKMPSIGKAITSSTYTQVVNNSLRSYATDGNIADTRHEIITYSRLRNITQLHSVPMHFDAGMYKKTIIARSSLKDSISATINSWKIIYYYKNRLLYITSHFMQHRYLKCRRSTKIIT